MAQLRNASLVSGAPGSKPLTKDVCGACSEDMDKAGSARHYRLKTYVFCTCKLIIDKRGVYSGHCRKHPCDSLHSRAATKRQIKFQGGVSRIFYNFRGQGKEKAIEDVRASTLAADSGDFRPSNAALAGSEISSAPHESTTIY